MLMRSFGNTLCLIALCSAAILRGETPPEQPDRKILEAVAQLESDDYETREEATRRLIFTGKSAVPTVEQAVLEGEPETRIRALTILEQILLKGNLDSAIAAQEALERLQLSDQRQIKSRVDTLFVNHHDQVEKAILQHFESLGGKLQKHEGASSIHRGLLPRGFEVPELTLMIGGDFKGSQVDLLKLRNVRVKTILHRSTVKIEDETRKLLLQSNPQLIIQERNIYLGIRFETLRDGMEIERILVVDVTPNTSASAAGILPGDEILSYDGKQITDQDSFLKYMQEQQVGHQLSLEIIRNGQPKTIVATLRDL